MHPILFTISTPAWWRSALQAVGVSPGARFELHSYGVLAAVAFLSGLAVARWNARRLGFDVERVTRFTVAMTISGLVGGRAAFAVANWNGLADGPLSLVDPRCGGFLIQGGIVTATVYGWFLTRKLRWPALRVGDLAMPSVAIANAIGRLGCLAAGCCYGAPSTRPFALRFDDPRALAPHHVLLQPVQIYDSLGNFVLFAICTWLLRARRRRPGTAFAFYFLAYPAMRIALECIRGDDDRGFLLVSRLGHAISATQAIGAVEILVCAVLVTCLRRRADSADPFQP